MSFNISKLESNVVEIDWVEPEGRELLISLQLGNVKRSTDFPPPTLNGRKDNKNKSVDFGSGGQGGNDVNQINSL